MPEIEQPTIDFRIYIGMILFRWKIIVICFLYALLGGVLYLDLAPKKYASTCKIIVQTESGSGSSAEQSRILWES